MQSDLAARDLEQVRLQLREFVAERDWQKFHSPKNLAIAVSVEAGELLEQFQWTEGSGAPDGSKEQIASEIADVMICLIRLADELEIDIPMAIQAKIRLNHERYPAEIVRGDNRKYDKY